MKNIRKNLSPNCNVFINKKLTVKNNEIAFLGRKPKRSGHLNKICTRNGTVHKYTVQKYTEIPVQKYTEEKH